MKGKLRKILSLALAVVLTAGALYLPAPADTVKAAGDEPEFNVHFTDMAGNPIEKATPGQQIIAVVSAENAKALTGFTLGVIYDANVFETSKRSNWTDEFNDYVDRMTDGYVNENDDWIDPVADSVGAVAPSEGPGSVTMATIVVVSYDQSPIEGVGDSDLIKLYLTVSEEASGNYDFSIARETYHLNGSRNANTIKEDPQLKATLTVEREPVPMKDFTLSADSLDFDLSTGDTTEQLSVASYTPEDTTDKDKEIKWSSANEKVATVDAEGNVTAVGKGDTMITATITNNEGTEISKTCSVHVGKSVTGITLSETEITLAEGQTKDLTATVEPADADDAEVTWTSSNGSIVTVDASGKVTAVGANGTATITASTANGTKAECEVTVKTSHLTGIAFDTESVNAEMANGETQDIKAVFTPDLANVTDEVSDVTWTSSDEGVLTVKAATGSDHASSAVITAEGNGTATITASVESNGQTFTTAPFEITVYTKAEKITVDKTMIPSDGLMFKKGETETIKAVIEPADADKVDLEWTANSDDIVSLTPTDDGRNCTVKALREGAVTVTVTDKISGLSATTAVKVTEIHINKVTISVDKTELNKGESVQASAAVGPEGTTDEDKTVTWSSSDDSVATVDQTGKITAVGGGKATITATSNAEPAVIDTVEITVNVPLTSISFKEGTEDKDLMKGQETTLTVTYDPEDTTVDKTVTWSVSGDKAAVELTDNKDGSVTVKALEEGAAVISAEVDGKTVEKTINVNENSVTGVALSVDGQKTVDLADGAFDVDLILDLEDEGIETTDDIEVKWTSGDENVATVTGDEKKATVTPVAAGSTTITATVMTDSGFEGEASCEIIVEIPMTGLKIAKDGQDITGGAFALVKDAEAVLTFAADPENTTDKIADVIWESSDPASVSVEVKDDGTAVVKTVKESEEPVVITATAKTDDNKTFTATVNVTAEEIHIESISLSETSLELEAVESETAQLTVTFNPDNTTDSREITWSSSDPKVATVDNDGVVTAVGSGSATILARTVNGKTAACEVYVPTHITGVDASDITLNRGETKAVEASVIPAGSDDDEKLTYEIDTTKGTPDAITLDGNNVTGVKEGTAYVTITATGAYGNVKPSRTIAVTVKETHLDAVEVTGSGEKDEEGVYQFRFDAEEPKVNVTWDEAVTDDVSVTYEVTEGADVVAVDANGYLTFLGEGAATIRVTATATDGAGNVKTLEPVEVKIYVDVIELEGITFAEDSKDITIETGREAELQILYTPEDTTDRVLTWTSSDPSVASVTAGENGTAVVKGLKEGTVTITAESAEGLTATTTVTVKAPVEPEDPKDPENPKDPADPSKPQGTDNKTDGTDKPAGGDTAPVAQTGDTAHPIVFAIPMILSLAAILFVLGKRLRNR